MNAFNFQEPGELEYINPDQCTNTLIIVWPIQHVNPAPPTKFSRPDKVDDAISVDVVTLDILDPEGKPKVFRSQLWRQSRLIQGFRQRIGQGPLLGTIGKGMATMGQPPWIFISLTHDIDAVRRANEWGAANADFKPSEPREYTVPPPQQAPAPQQGHGQQPYGQQQQAYGQQASVRPQYDASQYQQQQYGYQPQGHHGTPETMPPWAQPQQQQYPVPPAQQPQPQYQQQLPPMPPPLPQQQPQQAQGANPAQQSILERLARQHGQGADPQVNGPEAQQQYGY
jgi:hypothetical protein